MRNRFLEVMSGPAVVAGVSLIPILLLAQAGASSRPPMTPWGEPDLQGIWYAFEDVPLERPAEYAGREFLTDEEAAKRAGGRWIEEVAKGFNDPATRRGRDHREELGTQRDVAGAYNALWSPGRDHTKPSNRTSLIVDP